MITQNPIIGRAKQKLGGVYARTLYGKNVLQTCPPSRKGHQTPNEIAACTAFGKLSQLSNQVPISLLNYIYYEAPQGRSRRALWCKQLGKGMKKTVNGFAYDPTLITDLGTNAKVSEQAYSVNVASNQLIIPMSSLSMVGSAITTEIPCLILICPSENICISLLDYTQIVNDSVIVSPLSSTLLNKECWIFPLWAINAGTTKNPALAYGSFQLNN